MPKLSVTGDPGGDCAGAARVVFPGQGAMPDCMRELDARGLREAVLEAARDKPFLGICIGLQMLFEHSEEGDVAGLGVLPGKVRALRRAMVTTRRATTQGAAHGLEPGASGNASHPLWQGIADSARFYFVHSYYVEDRARTCADGAASSRLSASFYLCRGAAINLFAVQFHPEKRPAAGLQLFAISRSGSGDNVACGAISSGKDAKRQG